MPPPRHRNPGGTLRRITFASVVLVLAFGTYGFIELGSFLAREDSLQKADAVLVLSGTRLLRPLEAADLYRAGYGERIVLLQEIPEGGYQMLAAHGIDFASDAERARDLLTQLGVPLNAMAIPDRLHGNTAAEAITVRELSHTHGWRRIIIVSSKYHLRRAGFAFRRELRGTGIDVIMRGSRYDNVDPERWWRGRRDIRYVGQEFPRLIAYVLGLGA